MEYILYYLFFALVGLCWGSFLNLVAYRVTFDKPFLTKRSQCPSCNKIISWYDNIPIISWILLNRACRSCKKSISWIYPFIEGITSLLLTMLAYCYFPICFAPLPVMLEFLAFFLFFSALIIATATDLFGMVIPQFVSLYLIPLGIALSFFNIIPISFLESILGASIGYGLLWFTGFLFKKITKQHGIGEGDMELLGMIGSFLGIQSIWATLLGASLSGLIIGGSCLTLLGKTRKTPIPFGPFLVLGALVFFFLENSCSFLRFSAL